MKINYIYNLWSFVNCIQFRRYLFNLPINIYINNINKDNENFFTYIFKNRLFTINK